MLKKEGTGLLSFLRICLGFFVGGEVFTKQQFILHVKSKSPGSHYQKQNTVLYATIASCFNAVSLAYFNVKIPPI